MSDDAYLMAFGEIIEVLAKQTPANRQRLLEALAKLVETSGVENLLSAVANFNAVFSERVA